MRRIRTKKLPEFCVKLPPASYLRIMALSNDSGRSVEELLGMAISIFATAVANVHMMHPPKPTTKSKPKELRSAIPPIGGTVRRTLYNLTKGKP